MDEQAETILSTKKEPAPGSLGEGLEGIPEPAQSDMGTLPMPPEGQRSGGGRG